MAEPILIKAVLVYLVHEGKVLTILGKKPYAPHFGKLNGLGGKFEPEDHEDPIACARREVYEESGITLNELELVGEIHFTGNIPDKDFYVYIFLAHGYTGTPRCNPNEGELVWVAVDDLPIERFQIGDRYFMPWVFNRQYFKAKFRYEASKYIDHDVNFLVSL